MVSPKILTIDLETSPLKAFAWGPKWETSLIEVMEHMGVLSFSARWLNGKHITKSWIDYPHRKRFSDRPLIREVWKLLNEADIIITQNGKAFDQKILNSRFLFYKMSPPSPYKHIDLKLEARKYLRLPSYSLDDMCDYFGIGRKLEHEGFTLWKRVIAGDPKACAKMKRYNANDVILTETLYKKLMPFMSSHPNLAKDRITCPKCLSDRVQKKGILRTQSKVYQRWFCASCASWSKGEIKESFKVLQNIV